MKKITPLLLVIIFLVNLEGVYLLFIIQQSYIRKAIRAEIEKNISDKYLSVIIIPLDKIAQIDWVRENKEFMYEGQMFDVVRTRISNGQKYFYCIRDKKEQQLIAAYQKKCEQNKSTKALKKLKGPVFIFSCFALPIPLPIYVNDFKQITVVYQSWLHEILSPPPRRITLT